MLPRRRYLLPLLFVLPFAAVILSSYYYTSPLHISSYLPHSPTSTSESNFTFIIKLLTFDRLEPLRRCLASLSAADYAGDRVSLHVYVDHFRHEGDDGGGASGLLDQKLNGSRRILEFLDGLRWIHGEKLVHYRTTNAGLQAQWLEAWWPGSDDEFVFVVEDDLELSPLFYLFLKRVIHRYYYDPENYSPSIYGASLQRPRFVAGKHGNTLHIDDEVRLFLYQMVGTWGQLLFPKHWKEFRFWYDVHKAKGLKPLLQGMVTTGWYKRMGERIWTPWFIKFIHSRGYYNLYTNFAREMALSISHRDAGVSYGKPVGPDSYLLDRRSLDFDIWEMKPLKKLKWYDFCFSEILPITAVTSVGQLRLVLRSLHKSTKKTVILVSLYKSLWTISRNLLCNLEKLGVSNIILLVDNSEFLKDFTRRGYLVVDVNRFVPSARNKCPKYISSDAEELKESLILIDVLKTCLEFGYNSWMVGWSIIPVSGFFLDISTLGYDFMASGEAELMFVKSSPSSISLIDDNFICKMAILSNNRRHDHHLFPYIFVKALEEKGVVVERALLDEYIRGSRLGSSNASSIDSTKKMVFWSRQLGLNSVERELTRLNLWAVDEDSSCNAVVCHGKIRR